MFTKAGILFGLMLLAVRPAAAAMADYIPAFEINLEEDELPTMSERYLTVIFTVGLRPTAATRNA